MNRFASLPLAMLAAFIASAASADVVYETGFEAPQFSVGNLNGQDSWSAVPSAGVSVRTGGGPQAGTQFVQQSAGSIAERPLSSDARFIILQAYHRGAGAPSAQEPEDPAAAVISFVAQDASSYQVRAWDGNAPSPSFGNITPTAIQNTTWAKVQVALDYAADSYSVAVDNGSTTQRAHNYGFYDPSVTALQGFRASSEVGADLDSFMVTESDGDFDNDGFADSIDTGIAGGNPLDANARPVAFADKNNDGDVTILDAMLIARNIVANQFDIDGNGISNAADADFLYKWCVGAEPVMPPID